MSVRRRTVIAGAAAGLGWVGARRAAAADRLAVEKGISLWAFPPRTPIREAAAQAKAAGFTGIELAFAEDGEITMASTVGEMRALASDLRAAGMNVPCLATALLWEQTLSSDDPAVRAKATGIVRKMLELAGGLGTDSLLIVPGVVGRAMSPEMQVPYETVWQRSQAALRALAPEAARRKVVIAIENVWNRFLVSPLEMRRYLQELRSPWVQAYLDVGNVLRFGYPQDWVRTLGPLVRRVHVKDFKLRENAFVGLLEGDMPWKAITAAFRDIGYRGSWVAEVSAGKKDQATFLADTARAMDAILAM